MPMVQLPSGRKIFVRVKFVNLIKKGNSYLPTEDEAVGNIYKGTSVRLYEENEKEKPFAEAIAVCCPTDAYCRREGRQQVAKKLLRTLAGSPANPDTVLVQRSDRVAIMKAICPEYFVEPEVQLKQLYEKLKKHFESEPKLKVSKA